MRVEWWVYRQTASGHYVSWDGPLPKEDALVVLNKRRGEDPKHDFALIKEVVECS